MIKMIEWKTIKFFLSLDGVDEVQASTKKDLRCSCNGFNIRKNCKHTRYVLDSLEDGIFPVEISKYTPKDLIEKAKGSHEDFRNLLLHWGTVTVI
jgi:hypothetical protein